MNYEKNRKILTDVDGVLLDWSTAFDAWMKERNYVLLHPNEYNQHKRYGLAEKSDADKLISQFNESAWMGFLKPLRDSVSILDKFSSNNYHFECITSLSTDHWAGVLREMNLERFFGRGTIRRVRCIATGADKNDILKEYDPGYWWIEDKPENCLAGLNAGHKPILIDHEFNKDFSHPNIIRAKNWKEIYQIITEST